jgi:serine/threonine protein kinase
MIENNRYYFNDEIYDWESWSKVFHSKEAFEPLIQYILEKEHLPIGKLEDCKPGTNAVFKVGNFIVKVFTPTESGMNMDYDYYTELFSMERSAKLNISVPVLIAKGEIRDKYVFRYLIMEYTDGIEICDIRNRLTDDDKRNIGSQLREITDRMNTPSISFNDIKLRERELNNAKWDVFPESFVAERKQYIHSLDLDDLVYVHGDLNQDNILVDSNNHVVIIDFADALLAPREYELPTLICEVFEYSRPYLEGFFTEYNIHKITELCLKGILMHHYGPYIIKQNIGPIDEITSISVLEEKIYQALEKNK